MARARSDDATQRPEGLRERKKRQTREAIVAAAHDLFTRNGYHETTLAEIAAMADVSVSTVFGYFGTKEAILFSGYDAAMEDFIAWLDERLADEPAIDRAQRWWDAHGERFASVANTGFLRLIYFDPVLNGARVARMTRAREALAAHVARDLGEDPGDLRPRVIASAYVATLAECSRYRLERIEGDRPLRDNPYAGHLGELMRGGIPAMARMPKPEDMRPA